MDQNDNNQSQVRFLSRGWVIFWVILAILSIAAIYLFSAAYRALNKEEVESYVSPLTSTEKEVMVLTPKGADDAVPEFHQESPIVVESMKAEDALSKAQTAPVSTPKANSQLDSLF